MLTPKRLAVRRRYEEVAKSSFELKILFANPGVEITLSSSGNINLTSKDGSAASK